MAKFPSTPGKYIQESPDNPLPKRDDEKPQESEQHDRLRVWKEEFRVDRDQSDEWRRKARHWLAFVAGDQWSDEDKQFLKENNRPAVTVNVTRPIIAMVRGQEIQQREDIIAFAREEGDAHVAEVATASLDYVRNHCNAGYTWSAAFGHTLQIGMGWVTSRVDYDVNPSGDLVDDHADPLTMYWDYASKQRNLRDARRIWQVHILDVHAARDLVGKPELTPHELDAVWTGVSVPGQISRSTRAARDYRGHRDDAGPGLQQVRLVERQWWDMEEMIIIQDPRDGALIELTKEKARELQVEDLEVDRVTKRVYKKAIIGNDILLEEPLETNCFHTQCITGLRHDVDEYWYGMVPAMEDAQRWANNWLTQTIHIYKSMGKGGLEYETGAFADAGRAVKDWPKPTAAIEYNDGKLAAGAAREKPTGTLPNGFANMIPMLIDLVRQAAGVNPELLGLTTQASQDPSGLLEMQRKEAGLTMIAEYFDSMNLFMSMHGYLHLAMIKNFMNDSRLIRIVGDMGAQYVPMFLTGEPEDYDLIVSGVPTSPNAKERTWRIMQPLLPLMAQMPEMPPELWVEVAKLSPLPPQFAEKMAESLEKRQPTPEDQAKQKQEEELRIRAIVASILKDEGSAKQSEATAQLQIAKAQSESERVKLDAMAQINETISGMRGQGGEQDQSKALEIASKERQAERERDFKRDQADQDRALKRSEGEAERAFKRSEAATDRVMNRMEAKEQRDYDQTEAAEDRKVSLKTALSRGRSGQA